MVVPVVGFNSLRLLPMQFWTLANPRQHERHCPRLRRSTARLISTTLLGPERVSNQASDDSLFHFARRERLSIGDC
jgi:hypothetical protein